MIVRSCHKNPVSTDKTKTGISDKKYKLFDWIGLVKELCSRIPNEEFDSTIIAAQRYNVLGYPDYTAPELDKRYILITNLNTTYSPKFMAYCIKKGQLVEMKIHKTIPRNDKTCKVSYKELPIQEGDIIYMEEVKKQAKKIKVGDNWEVVPGAVEWWIKDYKLITRVGGDSE